MSITCTRRLQFAAGHRVLRHEGKCAHPHGHNYVVFLEALGLQVGGLDDIGRVIDFSVLKERFGKWIDDNWDHGFIVYEEDADLIDAFETLPDPPKLFVAPFNPTAENMAKYLMGVVGPEVLKGTNVHLTSVTVWETENCFAKAFGSVDEFSSF